MKRRGKGYTATLTVSLTPTDLQALKDAHAQTTCQTLAEYARRLLFRKDITVLYRNRSFDDFIGEGIRLRKELQAIREKLPFSPESESKLLELIGEIKINL